MRSVSGVCWGTRALALLARQPGEPPLPAFFLLVAWTGLPVFGLFLHFRRREEPFPVGRLILWAVTFRIWGLAGGPFYEDDFYRYLWDGYRFATTGTPYGPAPETFFVDPSVPPAMQSLLSGINYPELPTIYAPVTQVIFLLGYWVNPGSVAVLQAILILLDLALVVLLLRLAPARNVLLYAWCPLVIKEIAFTAHPGRRRRLPAAGCCPVVPEPSLAGGRHRAGAGRGSQGVRSGAGAVGAGRSPPAPLDDVRRHGGGRLCSLRVERRERAGVAAGVCAGVGIQLVAVRATENHPACI